MGTIRLGTVAAASMALALSLIMAACGGSEATATPPRSAPTATPVPAATATPPPAATATATLRATSSVPQSTQVGAAATPTPVPASVPTPTPAPVRPDATPTSAPAGPGPKTGGGLRIRYIGEPRFFDTYDTRGQAEAAFLSPVLGQLISVDPAKPSDIVGDLAESFTLGGGGTAYTFNVRRGVTWHDGKPFTSKDIVYNVERGRSTKDPLVTTMASRYALVDKLEAPDDFTVRITLKRPSASFLSNVAIVVSVMYPAHVPIDQFKTNPVGTGPFKFKSYRPGSDIVWGRSQSYWKKDSSGRSLPYLDEVQYFVIVDSATAAAAFRTGRTDLTLSNFDSDWTNPQRDAVRRQFSDASFLLSPTNGIDMALPQRAPWTDARVRKALHLAFDRQGYNALALEGLGEPLGGLMLPESLGGSWSLSKNELAAAPGFRADKKKDDIAAAKDLLKAAGVNPAALKLKVVGSAFFRVQTEGMASVVRDTLGFDAQVAIVSSGEQPAIQISGDFDIAFNSRSFYQDDPFNLLEPYVNSTGGRNYQKWVNPKVDSLLDAQDRTLDPVARKRLIQDLEREVIDWAQIIPLAMNQGLAITRAYVKNVTPRTATWIPAFYYRMENVWIDR